MTNEVTIPSKEELQVIPRWARVAFGARCARRVQPLIKPDFPGAAKYLEVTEAAIVMSERSAAAAEVDHSYVEDDTVKGEGDSDFDAYAHDTAYAAAAAVDPLDDDHAAAARDAAIAASRAFPAFEDPLAVALRYDYQLLRDTAQREGWTDETPVPPQFFGPLWPFGAPQGWPLGVSEAGLAMPELTLEFDIPDDVDPDEADAAIGQIIQRLSDLHTAMGGNGLEIADGIAYEPAMELEPVGPEGEER
jgi:hypothetical protein